MLYTIAHFLRNYFPWIWDCFDALNACLFSMRYGKEVEKINYELQAKENKYQILPISTCDASCLLAFFAAQPQEAFRFFRPHGFDEKSIQKLQTNKAFLGYVLKDQERIAAYFFLRSFFWGKCFRGRMVGIEHRKQGLGTYSNRIMTNIGLSLGMKIYETVSRENIASLKSVESVNDIKIVKEMKNKDLFIEIIGNKSINITNRGG
ncbi:MAG: transcriptional regulator [Prevotella sp.]|nr:transcriptional regulator [Prevotellaceae bacterium]MDY3935551.1 transcriptional regulator [Prevotella sp.]